MPRADRGGHTRGRKGHYQAVPALTVRLGFGMVASAPPCPCPIGPPVGVCFAGWRDTEDTEGPLVYILLASRCRAGHYHEFCVYKGSRAEHSAFLPPGFHESGFVVSVSVLVQDQLGATVVAINR